MAFYRVLIVLALFSMFARTVGAADRFFTVQAIDTMKFSRDVAREKISDSSYDQEIEIQIKNIARTGATHVGIGTPYDNEFIPYIKRWVDTARSNDLKIWFRGNFSGWEGWFDYPKIGQKEHLEMLKDFLSRNPDLFEDGDVFTSCPECENGGEGDPRTTGDVEGFRAFLQEENSIAQEAFSRMHKQVSTNYYSMNGDVAQLVMNKGTTSRLGGVITIDHYVSTPQKLGSDIRTMAQNSGGKVVLGEFGAPIPDIHGKMTEQEQADWVDRALTEIIKGNKVESVSYWTNRGGSTMLWNDDDTPRKVVGVLTKYYKPYIIQGNVLDLSDKPLDGVKVSSNIAESKSVAGSYSIPTVSRVTKLRFSKPGYMDVFRTITVTENTEVSNVSLYPIGGSFWHRLYAIFVSLFNKIAR